MPLIGSQWVAEWVRHAPNAYVWTVRDVTEEGVYITCPTSRSPGHLLSPQEFRRDYAPKG